MPEEKKNITCPRCGKDFTREAVAEAEGHCPDCEYNIIFHRNMESYREVKETEAKTKKPEVPVKKRLWL